MRSPPFPHFVDLYRAAKVAVKMETVEKGMEIADGIYGLILVEPKEGRPPDREYYVMQEDTTAISLRLREC